MSRHKPRFLREASIDRVNPTLYRDALQIAKMYRDTPREKGGHILDRINRKWFGGQAVGHVMAREHKGAEPKKTYVITRSNLNPLEKVMGTSVSPSHEMQVQRTRGITLPREDRRTRGKKHRQTITTAAHELLHAHDYRAGQDLYQRPVGSAGYYNHPVERLAHDAVAGTLGVKALKRSGVSPEAARKWLTTSKLPKINPRLPDVEGHARAAHVALLRPMARRRTALLWTDSPKESNKTYRKMAKEVYKGLERYHPMEKKKPKLPEGVDEASIDYMTPRLYRTARKVGRDVYQSRWRPSVDDDLSNFLGKKAIGHVVSRGEQKLGTQDRVISLFIDPKLGTDIDPALGRIEPASNYVEFKSDKRGKAREIDRKLFNRKIHKGRVMTLPPTTKVSTPKNLHSMAREQQIRTIAHELLHAHDPGDNKRYRGGSRSFEYDADYYASPTERHAYSGVAGTLGVRALRKTGATPQQARVFLRRAGRPKTIEGGVRKIERLDPKHREAWAAGGPDLVSSAAAYRDLLGSENRKHRKSGQKFFKELHKGMERQYGVEWAKKRKMPA